VRILLRVVYYWVIARNGKVGMNAEENQERKPTQQPDEQETAASREQDLLETVLQETLGRSNSEALKLITEVARTSKFKGSTEVGATEEVVRAILKNRFGARKFSGSFISRVATSLMEIPEAAIRLERLWQEARASG
jgi:hypothetical protein